MIFFSRKNDRGFTLIEVLVAMVVLSVGLLAVAGMQINSMRGSSNALHRSQAVMGAEDILDRMRANAVAAKAGDYDIAMNAAPGSRSSHVNMVLDDLDEWRAALEANLPNGAGEVSTSGNSVTVEVRWRDTLGEYSVKMDTRL